MVAEPRRENPHETYEENELHSLGFQQFSHLTIELFPLLFLVTYKDSIDTVVLGSLQDERFLPVAYNDFYRCIEHAFREAKSELAMADYQVRRWDAWHRHMALVMIAMLFLVKERLALEEEAPMLSLADLVLALDQLLPRPEPTPDQLARIIQERHRRRQAALASHLRRESEI